MGKNVNYAFAYLLSQGYTAEQASGIIGNLQQESGMSLDPRAYNPAEDAYGIVQWSNKYSPDRFANMEQSVASYVETSQNVGTVLITAADNIGSSAITLNNAATNIAAQMLSTISVSPKNNLFILFTSKCLGVFLVAGFSLI